MTTSKSKAKVNQGRIDLVYLLYILWQCEAFEDARKRLVKNLDKTKNAKRCIYSSTQRKIFADLQSAITSAANISKMLWPSSGTSSAQIKSKKRGMRLRTLIGISQDAVLQNKRIRNKFEHLDEYLDKWAAAPRDIVINMVSHDYDSKLSTFSHDDIFGLYDRKTHTLTILSESINLSDLCNAVWGVSAAALYAYQSIQSRLSLSVK